MEDWQRLELDYAKRLRSCSPDERKELYVEAYSAVAKLRMASMPADPEKRTAGTSRSMVQLLARLCKPWETVLEVGCGRGYTCSGLAPHVKQIVGTDVSDPVLEESRELLRKNHITNAKILKVAGDELTDNFDANSFDKVISIGVYEHLHPEDGINHLKQVYTVLKPDGCYILDVSNRLSGPHDMTRIVFPDAKEPLGFHLNETTVEALVQTAREIGFSEFAVVRPFTFRSNFLFYLRYPAYFQSWIEQLCPQVRKPFFLKRVYRKLLQAILIAGKKA